ncbi:hypothetical protein [Terrimonas ferruginea]|nr:hypothetical protein [Terrimonas ferruginea]
MQNGPEERVPLFRSWTAWYIIVLVALVAMIAILYFFTQRFS